MRAPDPPARADEDAPDGKGYEMKALAIFLLLAVLAMASPAAAAPSGEVVVVASSTITLCPATSNGPILVEAMADGTATIKLISTSRGNRSWPDTDVGDSGDVFNLRDGVPRPFPTSGDRVDQVVVVLGSATEVVLTWTFAK